MTKTSLNGKIKKSEVIHNDPMTDLIFFYLKVKINIQFNPQYGMPQKHSQHHRENSPEGPTSSDNKGNGDVPNRP